MNLDLERPELDPRRVATSGASEAAALFSLGWDDDEEAPYETRYALWMRKSGRLPSEDEEPEREALIWGQALEPGIARGFFWLTGLSIAKGEYLVDALEPRMSASLDYLVRFEEGEVLEVAPLELKNVDGARFRKWTKRVEAGVSVLNLRTREWEPATVQPPLTMKLQLQQQIACLGPEVRFGLLCMLVGGNKLRVFRIDRHDGIINRLRLEIAALWKSIEAGVPPAPDFGLDAETISALYAGATPGTSITLADDHAIELCAEYRELTAKAGELEDRKKAIKAELLTIIDDAERASVGGRFNISATMIPPTDICYTRDGYRDFRITEPGSGKKKKKAAPAA